MIKSYINLFQGIVKQKNEIVSNRNLFGSPFFVFLNFIFYLLNLKNFKKIKNNF